MRGSCRNQSKLNHHYAAMKSTMSQKCGAATEMPTLHMCCYDNANVAYILLQEKHRATYTTTLATSPPVLKYSVNTPKTRLAKQSCLTLLQSYCNTFPKPTQIHDFILGSGLQNNPLVLTKFMYDGRKPYAIPAGRLSWIPSLSSSEIILHHTPMTKATYLYELMVSSIPIN